MVIIGIAWVVNAYWRQSKSMPAGSEPSAKTATTPEIRKAKPVLPPPPKGSLEPDRFTEKTGTKPTPVSDAAVIAHADATAAEVTAAVAADPLHDHFPKPDPVFFNSLSDRQMELWEKEFKQRRLQQMQRQHP